MSHKILLFANVGTDSNGYCHIGDEAMFWEMYRFYRKNFPDAQLTSLVSMPDDHHEKIRQVRGLGWPDRKRTAFTYFLKLVLKTFVYTRFRKSFFTPEQKEFIDLIEGQDLVHYTGGGNLTSDCEHWFYYALLVAAVANLLRKPVVLSSQTIGPFYSRLDRRLAIYILNSAKSLTLREASGLQRKRLRKIGIRNPHLLQSPDGAYFLEPSKTTAATKNLRKKEGPLRIGLSLHRRGENSLIMKDLLSTTILSLSKTNPRLEIILLPHILDRKGGFDMEFLKGITEGLPQNIKIISPDYYLLAKNSIELVRVMKELTGTCDILLTSRYHGVIFSLSQAIPCISIVDGSYQSIKNIEALRFVFGNAMSHFFLSLSQGTPQKDLVRSLNQAVAKRTEIHSYLKNKNLELLRQRQKYLHYLKKEIHSLLVT